MSFNGKEASVKSYVSQWPVINVHISPDLHAQIRESAEARDLPASTSSARPSTGPSTSPPRRADNRKGSTMANQNNNKKVTGLPTSGKPATRRIHQGKGTVKADKYGRPLPDSQTGK
jgi:hypothetical protein